MSARRSLLFVFVLFVLLVFVGLREWQSIKQDVAPVAAEAGAATEPVTSSEPPIEYRDQRPQSIFDVQPAAMPEALRSWYRLRPDRRVLLAVSVLHSLTTGEPEPTLVVDFREGRWRLSQNGKDVGELPELASFEDGWRMLAGIAATAPLHASARAKDVTALQSALDDYSVRRLADALGKAGEQWRAGARTEDVLRIAVHGLLGLVLQGHDPLEQNDMLLARALAATVLLDRLGADTGRERALLADQFGYTREAGSIAMPLAAEDPVRAFVLREHATLRTLAEHPDASRFVRHLYLMRLADYRDIRGWSDWVAEHIGGTPFDLGLFRSAFMVQDFAGDRALSHQAPYLVLLETWRAAHPNGIAARVLRRAVDETDPGFAMAFGTAVTHGQ